MLQKRTYIQLAFIGLFSIAWNGMIFCQKKINLSPSDENYIQKSISTLQYTDAAQRYFDLFQRKGRPLLLYNAFSCLFIDGSLARNDRFLTEYAASYWIDLDHALRCKQAGLQDSSRQYFEQFIDAYKGDYFDQVLRVVEKEIAGLNLFHLANQDSEYDTETIQTDLFLPSLFKDRYDMPVFQSDSLRFENDDELIVFTDFDSVANVYQLNIQFNYGDSILNFQMPSYINSKNTNCIHPSLHIWRDKVVLFYSTDRPSGKGGFDIWMSIFDKQQKVFTIPINAGDNVNTMKDDVAPFLDIDSEKLYFSSNGHLTMGSFDIHSSIYGAFKWEQVTNCFRLNTKGADFVHLVSGRLSKMYQQVNSMNRYSFVSCISRPDSVHLLLDFTSELGSVELAILCRKDTISRTVASTPIRLSFQLKNDQKYRFDYTTQLETLSKTYDLSITDDSILVEAPILQKEVKEPSHSFKIQLAAVKNIRPNIYGLVRMYGDISYQTTENGLTRVLLTTWHSENKNEVEKYLEQIREFSWFEDAFLVTYVNGERQ